MVGLDPRRGLARGGRRALDDVGIERALHQEIDAANATGLFLEHRDKLVTDPAPLLLGI